MTKFSFLYRKGDDFLDKSKKVEKTEAHYVPVRSL